MLPYAAAILLGSFLLFQIEPIIGKFILPWFGGGPGVWATCLLFFQAALVAGYGYAHLLTRRLPPRAQAWVHTLLLAVSLALLPIIPGDRWKPAPEGNPTAQILLLLLAVLGLPYIVLSATGPLIQEWYRRAHPDRSPYRLYALSNVGSFAALIGYPFFFEWFFSRRAQANLWATACMGFAVICALCAWRSTAGGDAAPAPAKRSEAGSTIIAWVLLPGLASLLLVATTNKLCLDLAAVPFLWVLPLAIYLVSFVLCFDRRRWYRPTLWTALAIAAAGCVAKLLFDENGTLAVQMGVLSLGLLSGCMVCHGELYRLRPEPSGLTLYYLMIAVGGALGGLFVAVVAPLVFHSFAELPLGYALIGVAAVWICVVQRRENLAQGMALGALLALAAAPLLQLAGGASWLNQVRAAYGAFGDRFLWPIALLLAGLLAGFFSRREGWSRSYTLRGAMCAGAISAALAAVFAVQGRVEQDDVANASRDFFGVLTVYSYDADVPHDHFFMLMNGRTIHGAQYTDPKLAREPTTYYAETSGVGRAIASLPPGPRRLGLVGLGTGTLAAYLRAGDAMRIYEINPQVEALARDPFTYVPHALGRVDIVTGDARLSLEREVRAGEAPAFDLLALDAFSSDAIPVHLLTEQAMALYLKVLAPGGILAVHISNRFFNLEPVVANLARRYRLSCVRMDDDGNSDALDYESTWMLLARTPKVLLRPVIARVAQPGEGNPHQRLWTDDYTSLWQVLN